MNRERTVRALPRVLAVLALLAPFAAALPGIESPPTTAILLSPLVLVAAVLARATVTRDPVDVTLAAATTPCILAVAYALYEHLTLTPGAVWGSLLVALAHPTSPSPSCPIPPSNDSPVPRPNRR